MRKPLLLAVCPLLLTASAAAQGADDCSSAQPIAGLGPHAFDNNGATLDSPALCTTVQSNVWFAWTAPSTDTYVVDTCGQTSLDTKLAVFDGVACPPTVSLGCNDDTCSLQSSVSFPAVSGQQYLIEVGSFSTTTQGSGTFTFSIDPCSTFGDDGLEDNDDCASAVSVPSGSYPGLKTYKQDIDSDWYSCAVADGETITVDVLFIDDNGDIDAELFDACGGTLLDGSYSVTDDEQVTWTNATGGSVDVVWEVYVWSGSDSGCNDYDMDVDCGEGGGVGTNYCISTPNSTGGAAVISGSGSASITANDLVLSAEPVPDQSGLFFYGAGQAQIAFGNGFRCVAAPLFRLPLTAGVGGVMTTAVDYTNPPSASGQITAGSTWDFQAWFRDPAGGGAFFNLSDGLEITFVP